MKKLIFSCFLAFALQPSYASHIIGGEMSYRCLGNDDYEITMKLYRDCFNGVPPFDNPSNVFIFNSTGILVSTVAMSFTGSDTLEVETNCAVTIPYICAEQAIFTDTINLPPSPGGYTLVYQRCCRSSIIENIEFPTEVGMSVTAFIPDPSLAICNSSPVFINHPPFAFCVNVPINYDHSAVDPDGDSLVYELCNGVSGSDNANPYPTPPLPPPYADVSYVSPYSGSYPFNTNPPLAINPQTGILSGTPASTGIFSLAVSVKEYRNGNLLSVHFRELAEVYSITGGPNATGIENISPGSFDIYPNPANEEILVDATIGDGMERVSIFNARGIAMKTLAFSSAQKSISLDTHLMDAGLYFVQVVTREGTFFKPAVVMH